MDEQGKSAQDWPRDYEEYVNQQFWQNLGARRKSAQDGPGDYEEYMNSSPNGNRCQGSGARIKGAQGQSVPSKHKTQMCWFLKHTECTKGARCCFVHDKSELRKIVLEARR